MTTQTAPAVRSDWSISSSPAVGALVVGETCTADRLVGKTASELGTLTVVRVNYSTGRGTVRSAVDGHAVQIVRGRFGWCLADGSATPVRFATAIADDDLNGDVVCEESFAPTYEAVLLDEEPAPTSAKEANTLWNFHRARCAVCQTGARCERGELLVHNLLQLRSGQ